MILVGVEVKEMISEVTKYLDKSDVHVINDNGTITSLSEIDVDILGTDFKKRY